MQWSFGDGSVSQDASPVHVYAQPGIYQVCLIVSNANGTDTLCRQVYVGVTAVPPTPDVFTVKVFPNPVSGELYIESAIPMAENTTLVLLDIQGRQVSTISASAGATDLRFSVVSVPSGTYILLGRTPQKVLFWKKIVVQR